MKKTYIRSLAILLVSALVSLGIIGCGETVSGVGKDVRRVGRGVKTIFVRDSAE